MTRFYLSMTGATLLLAGCLSAGPVSIGHEAPTMETGLDNNAGLVFSPDGNTAYWYSWNGPWGGDATSPRMIYSSTRQDASWSKPVAMPFTAGFADDDPFVSPDGQWLYFISERTSGPDDQLADANIWRYSLDGARHLEWLPVNSDSSEYSPIITASGALFFASDRPGGYGRGDLYRSAISDNGFSSPELLGPEVNSPTGEWNLWVSPDETEMLFEASSRPTNVSVPGDIYYSWRTEYGWSTAVPVSTLNTKGSDLLPRLHPDGETLYYTTAFFGERALVHSAPWETLRSLLRSVDK